MLLWSGLSAAAVASWGESVEDMSQYRQQVFDQVRWLRGIGRCHLSGRLVGADIINPGPPHVMLDGDIEWRHRP